MGTDPLLPLPPHIVEIWGRLVPADAALLVKAGAPRDAITPDGVVDLERLVSLGFRFFETHVEPPGFGADDD